MRRVSAAVTLIRKIIFCSRSVWRSCLSRKLRCSRRLEDSIGTEQNLLAGELCKFFVLRLTACIIRIIVATTEIYLDCSRLCYNFIIIIRLKFRTSYPTNNCAFAALVLSKTKRIFESSAIFAIGIYTFRGVTANLSISF